MPKLQYAYEDPSGDFVEGQTPYGTYDSDSTFATDIQSVTKWCAKRLGFPVLQLEIPSGSIYACFEESVNEYSQHINNYNIKTIILRIAIFTINISFRSWSNSFPINCWIV